MTDREILESPGAYRAREADELLKLHEAGKIALSEKSVRNLEEQRADSIDEVRKGKRLGRAMGLFPNLLFGAGFERSSQRVEWIAQGLEHNLAETLDTIDVVLTLARELNELKRNAGSQNLYDLARDERGDVFGFLFAIAREMKKNPRVWSLFFKDGKIINPQLVLVLFDEMLSSDVSSRLTQYLEKTDRIGSFDAMGVRAKATRV